MITLSFKKITFISFYFTLHFGMSLFAMETQQAPTPPCVAQFPVQADYDVITRLVDQSLNPYSENFEMSSMLNASVRTLDLNSNQLCNAVYCFLKNILDNPISWANKNLSVIYDGPKEMTDKLLLKNLDRIIKIFIATQSRDTNERVEKITEQRRKSKPPQAELTRKEKNSIFAQKETVSILFLQALILTKKLFNSGFIINRLNIFRLFAAALMTAEANTADIYYRLKHREGITIIPKTSLKLINIDFFKILNFDTRILDIELLLITSELFKLNENIFLDQLKLNNVFTIFLSPPNQEFIAFISKKIEAKLETFPPMPYGKPNISINAWLNHLANAGLMPTKLTCLSALILIKRYVSRIMLSTPQPINIIGRNNIYRLLFDGLYFSNKFSTTPLPTYRELSERTSFVRADGTQFKYPAKSIRKFLTEFNKTLGS